MAKALIIQKCTSVLFLPFEFERKLRSKHQGQDLRKLSEFCMVRLLLEAERPLLSLDDVNTLS